MVIGLPSGPLEGVRDSNWDEMGCILRLVRFLYIIRWPHWLQRMGSLDLMVLLAPQSGMQVKEE